MPVGFKGEGNIDPLINTLSFLTSRCLFLISSSLLSVRHLSDVSKKCLVRGKKEKSVLEIMIDTDTFTQLVLLCHTINAFLPLIGPLSCSRKKV